MSEKDRKPHLLLRFLNQTNLTVTSLTACFILYTRSAGVAYFAAGAVTCSLTVKVLKHILRQPRPDPIHPSRKKRTYGMPSTHSATITYFAVYIPLACAILPMHPSIKPSESAMRRIPPAIVIPWAMLIVASRVWLGHHTWPQVAVGCSYGVAFAALWFKLWTEGLNDYGVVVEDWFASMIMS
ncbi:PAP2-domain-containing protein [Rickenella mellea]|uniref:PAP2-domain-containing protein n=1 Tax=Rickenella mellea TaxID=50990 RepID=A0A4Y7QLF3_9AGAM|nr:PAP2-domain-containing protein [Rickenella mellea]